MNGTRIHRERSHVRHMALWLITALTVIACAGDRSLAPRPAANVANAALTVAARTLAVGDEVLLWTSWSIPEGSEIDVIITGRIDNLTYCPPTSYNYDAAIQQKSQKAASGSTHFPGAGKLQSAEVFSPGTRLRFVRFVTHCDGAWNAYAFEVISLPGK